jgi:imidazoleglycerol-phosphate dehydratase
VAARPEQGRRAAVRVDVEGSGEATVSTGLPVLDHLVALLAEHASFDLAVDVAADAGLDGVLEAGRALGEALAPPLAAAGASRLGSASVPADEALALVALEASGRPLVVSNVDLSDAHVAGLGTDVVSGFVNELAAGAGLTLHVRLVEGRETQHVLDAIFKAVGVALGAACRPRWGGEGDG